MSQIFSKAAPTPPPPQTMPDPMSPATLEARRKAMQDANASGRSSTILTTAASRANNTLAGGGTTKLGS